MTAGPRADAGLFATGTAGADPRRDGSTVSVDERQARATTVPCEGCAEEKAGRLSFFVADCPECTVRAIAGGPDFFASARAGELQPGYRDLLRDVYGDDWQQGHERVKAEAARLADLKQQSVPA